MGLEEAVAYALSEEEPPTAVQAPDRRLASEVPPALTRREEEVAALVVQGLTKATRSPPGWLVLLFVPFLTRTQVNRSVVCLVDKHALGAYTAR